MITHKCPKSKKFSGEVYCGCGFVDNLLYNCMNCGRPVSGIAAYHLDKDPNVGQDVSHGGESVRIWPHDKCLFGAGCRQKFCDALRVVRVAPYDNS